jgi:hypothetical protein
MPEIPNPIRKPLVKKDEEMDITSKSAPEVTPVVEEAPVVKKEATPSVPKQYRCKVKCWVSSKKMMFEPGDYVTFEPGEFVPEHFE